MSAAAPAASIAFADVHLPTLYVGLPPPEDQIQIPLVIYQESWEMLSLREQRFFQRLSTLPFTEEEIRTFTVQLHEMKLVREDICLIYGRLAEGELSNERRLRLEETLDVFERRSSELEALLAVTEPRIMAALRRIEEREPANWDHLPEDPVVPIALNDVQRAALALVDETLDFVRNPTIVGAGPGAGAGAGTSTSTSTGWT
jgi:hypothetical protein